MARRRSKGLWLVVVLLLPLYAYLHTGSWTLRAELRQSPTTSFLVPSQFSRVLACGYKGLLADFQFLRVLTFYGDRSANQQPLTMQDWDYFRDSVDGLTDLDPYFARKTVKELRLNSKSRSAEPFGTIFIFPLP